MIPLKWHFALNFEFQKLSWLEANKYYHTCKALKLRKSHFTAELIFKEDLKKIKRYGTCYGQNLALFHYLLEHSLLPQMALQSLSVKQILYYQKREIHRPTHVETLEAKKTLLFSKPEIYEHLFILRETPCILRFWKEGQNFSHSIIYQCTQNRFWFYDSAKIGLFEFPNLLLFKQEFKIYLTLFTPKKNTCFALEIF